MRNSEPSVEGTEEKKKSSLCSETDTASVFDSKWNIHVYGLYISICTHPRRIVTNLQSFFVRCMNGMYEPTEEEDVPKEEERRTSTDTSTAGRIPELSNEIVFDILVQCKSVCKSDL